jgi:oligopeptidase B
MNMKRYLPFVAALIMLSACNNSAAHKNVNISWPAIIAPIAKTSPHVRILHDDTVPDNYYWMADYFMKGPDSTAAVDYLKAENTYLDTMMSSTRPFRDQLFTEMKGRIKEKDLTVPFFRNGYYYYTRTDEGQQYYKLCRKKGSLGAKEEVLLDLDQMAIGKSYLALGGYSISEDNKLMAYAVDEVSRRQYVIHIKNLETGELLKEAIPQTNGSPAWANDNKTFFYTSKNPVTLLGEKIKSHVLGKDPSTDVTVYEESDKSNYIGVYKSKNSRYIIIYSTATMSDEYLLVDANTPAAPFKLFAPRMKDVLYQIYPMEDKFFISTNWKAKNFRLMECPQDKTDSLSWKEVVPNSADVLIQEIAEFKDFLVLREHKNGLTQIHIRNLKDHTDHLVNFGEATYSSSLAFTPDYAGSTFQYNFSSPVTPNSVYEYNPFTKEKKLLKQQEVLGGYTAADYVTERLYIKARDGAEVPVSIVYKKGYVKNGKAPLLLYGYGSYGSNIEAGFSSTRLTLLNRGFAFAIAHIRGGEDMGRQWYEDGKLMKKKNTFTDFIDCGEYLVKEQYTSPEHLYAHGGSAGGLLMGAVYNMAPDLWHGVIAQVPFVDVVNTMLDESIPLTTNEFDEWGNPKNKDAYAYMKSYSPYENIEKRKHPNLLITTGLHDSQVQYFEPEKWIAKLRTLNTGDNVMLLKTNMAFGHGGASGRFDYLNDISLIYAFLFTQEGISK